MESHPDALGRGMRWVLMACGPMNLSAAVAFAPPVAAIRDLAGLPEAHPLYLWVMAVWLPIFGAAYFRMGYTGVADRTFLTVGAAGKATFALIVIGLSLGGDLPARAVAVGLPDLALAVLFVVWLMRNRHPAPSSRPT